MNQIRWSEVLRIIAIGVIGFALMMGASIALR